MLKTSKRLSATMGLFVFFWVSWVNAQSENVDSELEIRSLTWAIALAHLKIPQVDEEFCQRWLNKYLDTIDPAKLYFLSEDVAEFETYLNKMPEYAVTGNRELFDLVRNRHRTRVKSALDHALWRLDQEFDFTMDESIPLRHNRWADTKVDRIERWRLQLKHDLLLERMRTPERSEQIGFLKSRYESILKQSEHLREQEAIRPYLDSFCRTHDAHSGYITNREFRSYFGGKRREYTTGLRLKMENGRTKIMGAIPRFGTERSLARIRECELLAIRSMDGKVCHVREIYSSTFLHLIAYGLGDDDAVTLELYNERTQERFAVVWPRKSRR